MGGYDWPPNATVCDVAGGVGTLLAAVLRSRCDLRGVVVDSAGVLSEADTWLQAQGLAASFSIREWMIEAGPAFVDAAIAAVGQAVSAANERVRAGTRAPLRRGQ